VLAWVALGLTAARLIASFPGVDPDLWGHMAIGRETIRLGWPPREDPFSYVPTHRPFVYHEWLSGVTFFSILMKTGGWSLKALTVALGLLALTVAAMTARRLGASPAATFVVVLISLPSFHVGYTTIRPQAFTFLLFAVVLAVLVEFDRGRPRVLLLLPPLFLLWANLHGGFVAGLGAILLFAVALGLTGRRPWKLLAAGGAALIATLANPYGLEYWRYLARALFMARPAIGEWMPTYYRLLHPRYWDTGVLEWDALRVIFVVAALLAVLAARSRYWPGVLVLAVTSYLGLRHMKHLPLAAIAGVMFAPVHLRSLMDRVLGTVGPWLGRARALGASLAAGALALLVGLLTVDLALWTPWEPIVSALGYPVHAVDFLRVNDVAGNLATPFNWGEYVLWKLHPSVKVSFDGRYETVYPEEVAADNFNFMNGKGEWRRLLTRYPTEMVLVARAYRMAPLMAAEPGWTLVYEDPISALYFRADKRDGPYRQPAPTLWETLP
jgi:hypothetical protein